ncbi:AAA family ATPase [Vibrio fluvialis]|nr:AAA family ATPase [Vibrio fluvialis]
MKIIFVSGIHGVGKGTLCKSLKESLNYPTYSCSDLIKLNSEYIEMGKAVSNAEKNQIALLTGLEKIKEDVIILDGHFCLVGREGQIIELGFETFDAIRPQKIINVTCDVAVVHQRLMDRDGTSLDMSVLQKLQQRESERTKEFAQTRLIPIKTFDSGTEYNQLADWILKPEIK